MSDFSFEGYRDLQREPTPDLRGGSLPSLGPVDDALLSSVSALSAPNPRFETLIGVLHGMGLSAPTPQLSELWKWLKTAPHHRELVQFPSDRDLMELAERLDARITLFREADDSKVGYTFLIQPHEPQYRGVVFSFSNRTEVLAPTGRADSSELSVHPLPTVGPESQIAALREALRLLGVTRAAQVERDGTLNFGRPAADIGLDRVNFMPQGGFFLADLGEKYRIGRMTKCVLCEEVGKSDFEYVLRLGNREFQRETLRRLWDEWVVARPHSAERAVVMTDRELRSAARQVSGLVGLMREATAEGVTYSLQTVLLSDDLNGMRVVVTAPSREPQFDGGEVSEGMHDKMLMRVLGVSGILAASRARMMTRVMRNLAPEFDPAHDEPLPEVVDLGPSRKLCSSNVRLFLSREA